MTRITSLCVLGLCLAGSAAALENASMSEEAVQAQRARIAQERAHEEARYEQAREQCYQRFAVNDCLRQARVARRPIMEEIRRQEIILNDEDRRRVAAEQIQSLEDNQAQRAAEPAATQGARNVESSKPLTDEQRAENRRAFEEKQQRAREHKASVARTRAEKGGSPARPLPTSP